VDSAQTSEIETQHKVCTLSKRTSARSFALGLFKKAFFCSQLAKHKVAAKKNYFDLLDPSFPYSMPEPLEAFTLGSGS
jgi:hypothetical protein